MGAGRVPLCGLNKQPRVDFGSAETRFSSPFGAQSALRMHSDTSVFLKKSEVSTSLGHKSALHVHSTGIWRLKCTSPRACCSPSEEYYCFVSKMSTRGWILEAKKSPCLKGSSMYPPYFLCKTGVSWVLGADWQPYVWYSKLTIILIKLTKYTKFKAKLSQS